jgi:hypothetical protein
VSISTDEIYAVLLEIKGQLGEVSGKVHVTMESFNAHCAEDKKALGEMAASMQAVQVAQAAERGTHRGASRVWSVLGNVGSGLIGAVATYFSTKGSH